MKAWSPILALLLVLFIPPSLHAVHRLITPPTGYPAHAVPSATVGDFLDLDVKTLHRPDGKRVKWIERFALKRTQKSLARQVRKGKLDMTTPLAEAMPARGRSSLGVLSVIFGSLAALFLFSPAVILSLPLGIAGLVTGVVGLGREPDIVLPLIGTILSATVLALWVFALIWVSLFRWW